jgi:hypothetical protein
MENQLATPQECNNHYNHWLMGVVSAICRITKLTPHDALDLFNKCQFAETQAQVFFQLENVGIPRTSDQAKQFLNYWLYADSDERS